MVLGATLTCLPNSAQPAGCKIGLMLTISQSLYGECNWGSLFKCAICLCILVPFFLLLFSFCLLMPVITSYLSTWRATSTISTPFPIMASEDMEASQVLGKKCSKQLSLNIIDGYCINTVCQLPPASWATTFLCLR